jgi:hypothetical protein
VTNKPKETQKVQSQFREFRNIAAGCGFSLLSLLLVISILARPINWLQDLIVPWMFEHFPTWVFLIAGVSLLIIQILTHLGGISLIAILPISLLLSISNKSRKLGAKGFLLSACIVSIISLYLSIITSINYAGILWMMIGLSLGGIGIIPIAFVAALLKADWLMSLLILGSIILVFGLSHLSEVLERKTVHRTL